MKKFFRNIALLFTVILMLTTNVRFAVAQEDYQSMTFDEIIELAKGTKVTFYGWGGSDTRNRWLEEVYAPFVKENYDVDVEIVGMDIDQILSQLSNEKQAGLEDGDIDMIWINGENFKTARENEFLYGPINHFLPNYAEYIDESDPEIEYDFGYSIDGFESPYGKAQLVFVKDGAVAEETPTDAASFLEFVKAHPGKVTYPALPDFTGSAFVRNIIYEFVDPNEFIGLEADKEAVKELIQPAIDYLKELNPYLWNEGKTFPSVSPELENMFMDGEVIFNISYNPYDVALGIEEGRYPETAETFIFNKGSIGNTSFIAIAANSGNIPGALVAINAMLSPEMQLSQYQVLKTLPVLDNDKLSGEQKADFSAVDMGQGVLAQDELLEHRLPEMPAGLVPIIEEIWAEEVVGQ